MKPRADQPPATPTPAHSNAGRARAAAGLVAISTVVALSFLPQPTDGLGQPARLDAADTSVAPYVPAQAVGMSQPHEAWPTQPVVDVVQTPPYTPAPTPGATSVAALPRPTTSPQQVPARRVPPPTQQTGPVVTATPVRTAAPSVTNQASRPSPSLTSPEQALIHIPAAPTATTLPHGEVTGVVVEALSEGNPLAGRKGARRLAVLADGVFYEIPPSTAASVGDEATIDPTAPLAARVKGIKQATKIAVTDANNFVAGAAQERKVTIALVAPGGHSPDNTTPEQVAAAVRDVAHPFWSRQTNSQVRHTVVATHGWLAATATCDSPFLLWRQVADFLKWKGSDGENLLLYLPRSAYDSCGAGLATVGKASFGALAYVAGPLRTDIVTHELGHNLGLGHANMVSCSTPAARWQFNSAQVPAGCTYSPYGDYNDIMGASHGYKGSLSAANLHKLGFGPRPSEYITTSTKVTLRASDRPEPVVIATANGGLYFVEYRSATGRESWFPKIGLRPGVQIRKLDPKSTTGTALMDATHTGDTEDLNAGLTLNTPFVVGNGWVTITVVKQDSQSAVLHITFPKQKTATSIKVG